MRTKETEQPKKRDNSMGVALSDVCDFYDFLRGYSPEGMQIQKGGQPHLSMTAAFSVIYYLQEHLRVFPDSIEQCNVCGDLFDYEEEGTHDEDTGKFYCMSCEG